MTGGPRLTLRERYGGYALVTGAARGIGRAFAEGLASEGFDLLLVDRRLSETAALARTLTTQYGVGAHAIERDLTEEGLADDAATWAETYDIGMLVSNAGISPLGGFLEIPLEIHLETLDLNSRATLVLTHTIGRSMARRGRGGIIVVSSASAIIGAPYTAHYAATKAYGLNLATSLWGELRRAGIDVLAVCPGLTDTAPVRERHLDESASWMVPIHPPEQVARGALRGIGRQPLVIPAAVDRLTSTVMSRLLPRRWTLSLVAHSIQRLRSRDDEPV